MTDAEGNEIGKLFVGGLSQATNNASLRLYFSRFGEVEDAVVMMDNKTGRSRGFGYVKYRDAESVCLALEAKPHILDSKEIDAKQCNVNMKGRNRRSLKIFVGGIGLDQDADSIKHFFHQFGRVTDVNLMMDSNKQRHRGFAFVGFEDEVIVKRLINMHYVTMHNKQVEIKAMEPPNFGRKTTSAGCVNAASILPSSQPNDMACSVPFDPAFDPSTLLTSGLHPLNAQTGAFLVSQTSPNLLGQQRQLAPTMFDQPLSHSGYVNAVMPDAMFPSPAFIQTISSDQHALRAVGTDPALLSTNLTGSSYSSLKHSIPYFLAGGQIHQASTSGLVNYPTAASSSLTTPGSSLYTTIPCELLSQSFLPTNALQQIQPTGATPHPSLSQLIGNDKGTLVGWPGMQPAQFTLCSPNVTAQGGLLNCAQYAASNSGGMATTIPLQQVHTPGNRQTLTPYYTVCPQYAAIQIQPENQATPIQYSAVNPNRTLQPMVSSTVGNVNCSTPLTLSGSRDAVERNSCLPSSRPSTPNPESKTELGRPVMGQSNSATFAYPTILMPAQRPSGITQAATLIAPAANTLNLNSAMWSQPSNGVVYPQVPVGWSVHHSGQATGGQQWQSPVTLSTPPTASQQAPCSNGTSVTSHQNNLQNNTKCNGSQIPGNSGTYAPKQLPTDATSITKASGDSLDSLMSTGDLSNAYVISEYTSGKIGHQQVGLVQGVHPGHDVSTTFTAESQQAPGLSTSDLNTWQTCTNDIQHVGNSAILPPWLLSSNGSLARLPMEVAPTPVTCSLPANMIFHPSSWTVPIELLDDPNSGYDMSMLGAQVPTNNGMPLNIQPTPLAHGTPAMVENRHPQNINVACVPVVNQQNSQKKTQIACEKQSQLVSTGTDTNTSTERQQTVSIPSKGESTTVHNIGNINSIRGSMEYPTWLYSNNNIDGTGQHSLETIVMLDNASKLINHNKGTSGHAGYTGCSNTNSTKEMQATGVSDVEAECQGPTGGPAGDFHRPIHTGHFNPYHVAH